MRSIKYYLLIFSLFYVNFFSQLGSFDPTFNSADNGLGKAANGTINAVALQADNKMIIGGQFTEYAGVASNKIARINADGTLDTSFNAANLFAGLLQAISNLELQPDGKIIATGNFSEKIVRINSDGSKDTSFNAAGSLDAFSVVKNLKLLSNGRILVAGGFANNVTLMELNPNGTLAVAHYSNGEINNMFFQPDGKMVVSGNFNTFDGFNVTNNTVRLNINGSIDNSFTPPGSISIKEVTPDGKLYVIYNGGLARLNSNGMIDTSFNGGLPTTFPASAPLSTVALQQDGKIIVGGFLKSNNIDNKLIRLNQDGTLDTSFDGNNGPMVNAGYTNTPKITNIKIQPDGKIIVVGDINFIKGKTRNGIVRILSDGSVDSTFNKYMGFDGGVSKTIELPDHRILVIGSFKNYNEIPANKIALLNEDGSLSSSFVSSGPNNGHILDAAVQPDGKIVIVGSFTTYNNIGKNYIARINQDGTLDTTFNIGTGASYYARAVTIQPDGKILIGGEFSYINGLYNRRMARLNNDGSVDTTFVCGVGTNNMGYVDQIVVQADSKILIAGYFPEFINISLRRINSNGSSDTSFVHTDQLSGNVGGGIALQADGKIIVGKTRLNYDGSVDASFVNYSMNTGALVNKIISLPDHKVLIAGKFTTYNGISMNSIALLNSDGSLNNSFVTGTGTNDAINDIIILHDQKILIGGAFISYNGNGKNHIARLNGSIVLGVKDITLNKDMKIYPNPVQNILYINSEKSVKKITIHNFLGQIINGYKILNPSKTEIDVSDLNKGNYIVTVELEAGVRTFKVIKN